MVLRLDGCVPVAKPLRSARGGRPAARAVLDDLRPCRAALRPRMEPLRPRGSLRSRPRASASAGSGSGTPISRTSSRRGRSRTSRACSTTTASSTSSSSSSRTGSSTRATSAAEHRTGCARSSGSRSGAPHASRQGGEHPRHAVRPGHADRALRGLCRRRRAPRLRESLRVHAARRQRARPRHGARARRGRERAERRPRDRHLAHGEARNRADLSCVRSRPPSRLGRALRRPVGRTCRIRSTRRSITELCPAKGSSRSVPTSPRSATRLRRPVGRRGALGGAARTSDRGDLRPRRCDEPRQLD